MKQTSDHLYETLHGLKWRYVVTTLWQPSDRERYTVGLQLILFDAGQQKHGLVPPGGLFTGSDGGIVWDDIQLKAGNFGFLQQLQCLVTLDAVRACADGRCVSNLVR